MFYNSEEIMKALAEGESFGSIMGNIEDAVEKLQLEVENKKLSEAKAKAEKDARDKRLRGITEQLIVNFFVFLEEIIPQELKDQYDIDWGVTKEEVNELVDKILDSVDEILPMLSVMLELEAKKQEAEANKTCDGSCENCCGSCSTCNKSDADENAKEVSFTLFPDVESFTTSAKSPNGLEGLFSILSQM